MTGGAEQSAQIEEAARRWLVYLHSGDARMERLHAFERWIAEDPVHERAFREQQELMDALAGMEVLDAAPAPKRAMLSAPPRWAAAGLAMAAAAAFVLSFAGLREDLWRGATQAMAQNHYETQVAEIRTVSLPDGTRVTLGAHSRIEVRFTSATRIVTLKEGEAFFEIAPDASRQFYVNAGDRVIRDIGTSFEVRRSREQVRVSVVEGEVELLPAARATAAARREPSRPDEMLRAGDSAEAAIGGGIERSVFEPDEAAAWRRGWLAYDGAKLSEIVADINRYSQRRIELDGEAIGDIRVTAAFGVSQIDQFVAGLEASQPVWADRSRASRITLRAE